MLIGLINNLIFIIGLLIPLIIGIGVVLFLWGILKYVIAKGPEGKKNAIGIIVYGILAIFVMISVWGLVNVLSETFRLSSVPGGEIRTERININDLILRR